MRVREPWGRGPAVPVLGFRCMGLSFAYGQPPDLRSEA